jgi:hypothetical protein
VKLAGLNQQGSGMCTSEVLTKLAALLGEQYCRMFALKQVQTEKVTCGKCFREYVPRDEGVDEVFRIYVSESDIQSGYTSLQSHLDRHTERVVHTCVEGEGSVTRSWYLRSVGEVFVVEFMTSDSYTVKVHFNHHHTVRVGPSAIDGERLIIDLRLVGVICREGSQHWRTYYLNRYGHVVDCEEKTSSPVGDDLKKMETICNAGELHPHKLFFLPCTQSKEDCIGCNSRGCAYKSCNVGTDPATSDPVATDLRHANKPAAEILRIAYKFAPKRRQRRKGNLKLQTQRTPYPGDVAITLSLVCERQQAMTFTDIELLIRPREYLTTDSLVFWCSMLNQVAQHDGTSSRVLAPDFWQKLS